MLDVDVKDFFFKNFFLSPSSITKEPDSMSLSVALTVGRSAAEAAPIDKISSKNNLEYEIKSYM